MNEVFNDGELSEHPSIVKVKQLVLEKILVSCEVDVSRMQLESMRIDSIADWISNRYRIQLRQFLLGENLHKETVRWKYPADWREAFKERWFPKSWLKRWPVRYTKKSVTFDVKAIYPKLNFSLPQEEKYVTFTKSYESEIGRAHV